MAIAPSIVNLGCGGLPAKGFVNVDIVPAPGVICHDLRKGVPFPDETFELVYNSTMLSHFRRGEALAFVRECLRVLKPGGLARIVTEDLEQLTRDYLQVLEDAWAGDPKSGADHAWLMLELFDQAARERPGGEMVQFLQNPSLLNEDFVRQRVGQQGDIIIRAVRAGQLRGPRQQSLKERLRATARKMMLRVVLGEGGPDAFDVGRFRLSGGASYHMYDRFSLRQLLTEAGFVEPCLQTPETSRFPKWGDTNVDLTPSGTPARPHCLIMEAYRPCRQ